MSCCFDASEVFIFDVLMFLCFDVFGVLTRTLGSTEVTSDILKKAICHVHGYLELCTVLQVTQVRPPCKIRHVFAQAPLGTIRPLFSCASDEFYDSFYDSFMTVFNTNPCVKHTKLIMAIFSLMFFMITRAQFYV